MLSHASQEQYYATHQCFYSKRSLYLVVFRLADGEKGVNEVDEWMRNIQVSGWGLAGEVAEVLSAYCTECLLLLATDLCCWQSCDLGGDSPRQGDPKWCRGTLRARMEEVQEALHLPQPGCHGVCQQRQEGPLFSKWH